MPHDAARARPDGVDGWVVRLPGEPGWWSTGPSRELYIGRRGVGIDPTARIPLDEIERAYWAPLLRAARLVVVTGRGDLVLTLPVAGRVFSRQDDVTPRQLDGIVALIMDAVAQQGHRGSREDVPEALGDLRER